jgi:hypothetical protein
VTPFQRRNPKLDLPIGAVGLLLAVASGTEIGICLGRCLVPVGGQWIECKPEDIAELENRRLIDLSKPNVVTLTKAGRKLVKRYADATR